MKDLIPYYAVIFTSKRTEGHHETYGEMAQKMAQLVQHQKGFLGMETARNDIGITISYWESLEAIQNWKENWEHLEAQNKGKIDWYEWYKVRICKIEREYDFET
ncbi:MAG: antibiotic biosynthesis monooxygenase [Flavobacteriaceae bacterium]|nr:antibiotic biosynthesis monooxygenase [Flavobacteriaceae bacterium]